MNDKSIVAAIEKLTAEVVHHTQVVEDLTRVAKETLELLQSVKTTDRSALRVKVDQ